MNITVISDTHGKEPVLPGGELLIHCGDLSIHGFRVEVINQLNYLHEQLEKYDKIILIPGNHDLFAERHPKQFEEACAIAGLELLMNNSTTYKELKIWGSPVTPIYHDWAFNRDQSKRFDLYENIPHDTQLVVTHGPPRFVLDQNHEMKHIGCSELHNKIREIKPLAHVFGHCHESKGMFFEEGIFYANCAESVVELVFSNGIIKPKNWPK